MGEPLGGSMQLIASRIGVLCPWQWPFVVVLRTPYFVLDASRALFNITFGLNMVRFRASLFTRTKGGGDVLDALIPAEALGNRRACPRRCPCTNQMELVRIHPAPSELVSFLFLAFR